MLDIARIDALRIIERSDPNGDEFEPTDAECAAHRRWAIDQFGQDVWNHYQRGGWAPILNGF